MNAMNFDSDNMNFKVAKKIENAPIGLDGMISHHL